MKKITFAVAISAALFSCKNAADTTTVSNVVNQAADTPTTVTVNTPVQQVKHKKATPDTTHKEDDQVLAELLKSKAVAPVHYTIATGRPIKCETKHGYVITALRSELETFAGTTPTGRVDVEITELPDRASFVRNNAQTVSNGRLLVSGGSFYVKMSWEGNSLRLKKGAGITIDLPTPQKGMDVFYGDPDTAGRMNWRREAPRTEPAEYAASDVIQSDDAGIQFEMGDRLIKSYIKRKPIAGGSIPSTSLRNMTSIGFDGRSLTSDIERLDTADANAARRAMSTTTESIRANRLGWINCDRFYTGDIQEIKYAIAAEDSIGDARLYVVYKSINSVLQLAPALATDVFQPAKGPLGEEAYIVAVGVKKGEVYSCKMPVKFSTGNRYRIAWNKSSEKDIDKLFAL